MAKGAIFFDEDSDLTEVSRISGWSVDALKEKLEIEIWRGECGAIAMFEEKS